MSRGRAMTPDTTPAVKLTYRDFLKFPDDGKRHELIDGEHYVTPCPNTFHQAILGNLFFLIRLHLESHRIGVAYLAPFDIVFSMFDVVEPDLLYISNERRGIVTEKNVQGSPDLVVEIGSKSTRRRDEGVKLRLYDRFEVLEYWVVDPEAESIRVYRRRDGRLVRVDEVVRSRGDALQTPVIPGLALSLARVFER